MEIALKSYTIQTVKGVVMLMYMHYAMQSGVTNER